MADKKISALTSLAQGDVAVTTDVLPIVDTSATETKKVTAAALVGAGLAAGVTSVDINSGSIDGTTIGANSAAAGTFTNLTASGTVSFSGATVSNGGSVTTVDINGGTIDGASIGASSASTGSFTTLTTSSTVTLNGGTANGVLYLNGSKVATSGSALTYDGTTLTTGRFNVTNTNPGATFNSSGGSGLRVYGSTGTNQWDIYLNSTNLRFSDNTGGGQLVVDTGAYFGGNVGIGTSSPSYKLHVATNAGYVAGFQTTAGADYRPVGWFNSAGTGVGSIGLDITNSLFKVNAVGMPLVFGAGTDGNERARIDSSGNLGIGTSSPSVPLTVKARSADDVGVRVLASSNNSALMQFTDDPVTAARGTLSSTSTYFRVDSNGGYLSLATGGTERARIDSSGNLLVGATSQQLSGTTLQVGAYQTSGDFTAKAIGVYYSTVPGFFSNSYDGTYSIASIGINAFDNSDGSASTSSLVNGGYGTAFVDLLSGTGGGIIRFRTGTTERARITSGGNFGVGLTDPQSPIEVQSDSGGTGIRIRGRSSANTGTLRFYANNGTTQQAKFEANDTAVEVGSITNVPLLLYANSAERARITSGGLVGIGMTPTGSYSLQIYGIGSTTGSARIRLNNSSTGTADADGGGIAMEGVDMVIQNSENGVCKWEINGSERARITSGGEFIVGSTVATLGDGIPKFWAYGTASSSSFAAQSTNAVVGYINRNTDDGTLLEFRQADVTEGSISVSGNTVSYNAFAGSHWSQLQDGSKPDILRGTVMESINELCVWPGEQNERLPKSKVSDTAGSKKVYGVFMAWDNDWSETNDMYVTAVGAFICRVNGSVTVQEGDLLESNGDGTARVQADDIIRSSTIGKVTSTVKTHQYADGSYCVPTVLYCG